MKKKFTIAFLCAMIAFSTFYIYAEVVGAKNPFKNLFAKETDEPEVNVEEDENKEKDEQEEDIKVPKEKISGELFFVVMGVDGDDVKDISKVKGQRTDTMILTKLNFDTGEIVMMNLPRDTRVNSKKYGVMKLNAGHAKGGNEGIISEIRDLTNLDLRHYVKVDYEAVRNLVDAIGGVEFDVPVHMYYYDPSADPPLDIDIKQGLQVIDGPTSIKFLRWRHNSDMTTGGYGDGSDLARIKTQQQFIQATIKQALSFKNLFKLPTILKRVLPNVDTNISIEKMIAAAASADKLNVDNITSLTLPGEAGYIGQTSYFIADKAADKEAFKQYFGNYYMGD